MSQPRIPAPSQIRATVENNNNNNRKKQQKKTHMRPRPQPITIQRILVEPLPLLKRRLGNRLVLVRVPLQHPWIPLDARRLAECLDHAARVIQQVICIDDADFHVARVPIRLVV